MEAFRPLEEKALDCVIAQVIGLHLIETGQGGASW
jgi:hypothetical protein